MSKEIDQRVVEMQFDNSRFERNVETSMRTIDRLKEKLNFDGQAKSFDGITKAAEKVDVSILEKAADAVSKKFSAMEVMAITAISNVTNKVISGAENLINQVSDLAMAGMGWDKYNKKVQAVQTIMKATGEDIDSVSFKLQDLSDYTDKTSYSYSQMVDNIGKFTANGVALGDAIKAIEGVANVAALSGVGATDPAAARAMYNFSQALAAGSVKMIDWKSIENANMATKQFKEQIIKTAKALGTLNSEGKTLKGTTVNYQNFRETLQESWFTSDVLIATLKEFADAESEIGKQAYKAAAEAKTFQDALGAIQDAVSSSWSQTFELIFGNYEQATTLWTGIQDTILEFLAPKNEYRNNVLTESLSSGYDRLTDFLSKSGVSVENFEKELRDGFLAVGYDIDSTMEKQGINIDELFRRFRDGGINVNKYVGEAIQRSLKGTGDLNAETEKYKNLVDDIINGKYGHGEERFARLAAEGFDADFVQERVNDTIWGNAIDWADLLKDKVSEVTISYQDLLTFARESGLSLKELMDDVGELSGRFTFWDSVRILFASFSDILGELKNAWKELFPPITGKQISNVINKFHDLAEILKPSEETLDKIRRTFSGLFSIFRLGYDAIVSVGKGIWDFVSGLSFGDRTILDFTAALGDNIKGVTEWIRGTGILPVIADSISTALSTVYGWISKFIQKVKESGVVQTVFNGIGDAFRYIFGIITKADGFSAEGLFGVIGDSLSNLWKKVKDVASKSQFFTNIISLIDKFWTNVKDRFTKIYKAVENAGFIKNIEIAFVNLWTRIVGAFTNAGTNLANIWAAIQTFSTDVSMAFWGLWEALSTAFSDLGYWLDGIWKNLKTVFESSAGVLSILTTIALIVVGIFAGRVIRAIGLFGNGFEGIADSMYGMSKAAKKMARAQAWKALGELFISFGKAVAIIGAVIAALSFIPPDKIEGGIKAVGLIAAMLGGMMVLILALSLVTSKVGGEIVNVAKLTVLATIFAAIGSLFTAIAYAIITLMGAMPDGDLTKVYAPITVLLGSLLGVMGLMFLLTRDEKQAIKGALAIAAIALYFKLATQALKELVDISPDKLLTGLIALGGMLIMLVPVILSMSLLGKRTAGAGFGILLMVMSLNILLNSLKKLAGEDMNLILKGLENFIPIFTVLTLLSVSLIASKKSAASTGIAVLAMAGAIMALTYILKVLGNLTDDVWGAGFKRLMGLAAIVAVFAFLAGVFSKVNKSAKEINKVVGKGKGAHVKKTSTKESSRSPIFSALIGITVVLTAMSAMVALLGALPVHQLTKGVVAVVLLGLIISAMMAAVGSIGKGPNAGKLTGTVVALAAIVLILSGVLIVLATLPDPKAALTAAESLALVLGALAAAFWIIGKSKGMSLKDLLKSLGSLIIIGVLLAMAYGTVRLLSTVDVGEGLITKALVLGGLFAEIVAAFYVISKAKRLDKGEGGQIALVLLGLSACLAATAGVMMLLNFVKTDGLIEKAIVLGLLFAEVIAAFLVINRAVEDGVLPVNKDGGRLAFALGVLELALAATSGVMILLNLVKTEGLLEKALALGGLFAEVIAAFLVINKACDDGVLPVNKDGGRLLFALFALELALAATSGVMILLNLVKTEGLLEKALALAGLFAAVIAAFVVINKAVEDGVLPVEKDGGRLFAALAVLELALLGCAAILVYMSNMNVTGALPNAFALALLLVALTAVTAGLGAVGKFLDYKAVISGLKGFLIVVAVLGLLMALIGGTVSLFPDLETWVDTGIGLLVKIAEGIGKIVGALFGGMVEGFMESIGKLKDVAEDIKAFCETLGSVDTSKLGVMKDLAGALLAFTANSVLDNLLSLFAGDKSYDKMFDKLGGMGTGLADFVKSLKDVTDADIDKAKLAADIMAIISEGTPRDGGLVGAILGNKDYSKFANGIKYIAQGIQVFSTYMDATTVDDNLVTKATNVGKIMEVIGNGTPRDGGLVGALLGNKDYSKFSNGLKYIAIGINTFAGTVAETTIDENLVTKAANAGKVMEAIADAVPKSGGFLDTILGGQDFEGFSKSLPLMGSGVAQFAVYVNQLKDDFGAKAAIVASVLTILGECAPSTSGLWGKIVGGEGDLGAFSENLPKIGYGVAVFAGHVNTISSWYKVQVATDNLRKVVEFSDEINGKNMDTFFSLGSRLEEMSMQGFSRYIEAFGDTGKLTLLRDAVDNIVKIVVDALGDGTLDATSAADELVSGIINSLSTSSNGQDISAVFQDMGSTYVSKLSDGISSETEGIVNTMHRLIGSLVSEIGTEQNRHDFVVKGNWIVYRIAEGMCEETPVQTVIRAAEEVANAVKQTLRDFYNDFVEVGKYFLYGLRDGLSNPYARYTVTSKAESLATTVVRTLKGEWSISSPSKVAESLGSFFVEGLGEGLLGGTDLLSNITSGLGGTVTDGLGDLLGGTDISSLFSGLDLSSLMDDNALTLTPVLDLSQISSGLGDITSMFSGSGLDLGATGTFSAASLAQSSGFSSFDLSSAFSGLSQQMADFINTPNTSITNTFNITGDDPTAIADEVSRVLAQQTQRENAVWA